MREKNKESLHGALLLIVIAGAVLLSYVVGPELSELIAKFWRILPWLCGLIVVLIIAYVIGTDMYSMKVFKDGRRQIIKNAERELAGRGFRKLKESRGKYCWLNSEKNQRVRFLGLHKIEVTWNQVSPYVQTQKTYQIDHWEHALDELPAQRD